MPRTAAVVGRDSSQTIRVVGLRETTRALQDFAPDLKRQFLKDLRSSLNVVVDRAKALTPQDTGASRAGIKIERGKAKSNAAFGYKVVQISRGGAILEFAGRVNPKGLDPQGAAMIQTANERYGATTGRFLWRAFNETIPDVEARATEVINEYQQKFQRRLDAIKAERS